MVSNKLAAVVAASVKNCQSVSRSICLQTNTQCCICRCQHGSQITQSHCGTVGGANLITTTVTLIVILLDGRACCIADTHSESPRVRVRVRVSRHTQ